MADIKQKTQAGNHVRILVNGVAVGAARNARIRQDYGAEAAYVIGDDGPMEVSQLRWSGHFSVDEFVIQRNLLGEATQLMDLVPHGPQNMRMAGKFDFEVLDSRDQTIMVLTGCVPSSHDYNVTANQFSGQSADFQAEGLEYGGAWKGSYQGPIGN